MADLKEFAEQLANLTVKEVSELAIILKDEYGIEPAATAAPVMVSTRGCQIGNSEAGQRIDRIRSKRGQRSCGFGSKGGERGSC